MRNIKLGIIGYGKRARWVSQLMCSHDEHTTIKAIADPNWSSAYEKCGDIERALVKDTTIYSDADKMLDSEDLDGVIVATRCSLHSQMALRVLDRDIPLYLEKPIAIHMDDLLALRGHKQDKVLISYPLRVSSVAQAAKKLIDSGKIGIVEHIQAINNASYGGRYFQNWYRDDVETGGMYLQKAVHDLDCISYLMGSRPVRISAINTKKIFHGNNPAGLKCSNCPEKLICCDSPHHPMRQDRIPLNQEAEEFCAYAVDTGNDDANSAIIEYSCGGQASFSQNFVVRNKAGKRTMTIIGYHGTIEFNWYTDKMTVYMHHSPETIEYDFSGEGWHGGGDDALAMNFLQVIRGEALPVATLDEAIETTLLAMKANESAHKHTVETIEF
jgi:predicted dehydrogenase